MSEKTGIAWCDHTFNTHWGCQKVSAGCQHCYAETFAKRVGQNIWGPPDHTDRRLFGDKHWAEPLRWNAKAQAEGVRRRVFCSSMADVFEAHPALPPVRARLWALIEATPHLDWQLLTKRPENIIDMAPAAWFDAPPPNVWFGTSCEDQAAADERIPHLLAVPAAVRFLSCEPLIGPVEILPIITAGHKCTDDWCAHPDCASYYAGGIQWVIAGGESGPRHRPMDPDWARALRDECEAAGVAYFFKQSSGTRPGQGRELDGRLWEEFPAVPS